MLIARNPDPDSRLPHLLRLPPSGGMVRRTSGAWPRAGTGHQQSYLGSKMTAMAAAKYSASMEDVLLADARADAEAEGLTLSSWLAAATADRLRLKALHRLVDEWEAEHGAITAAEIDALEDKVAEARRGARERRRPPGREAGRAVAS